MRIGIKESRKYKDISWLMPSVDVVTILEKLDVTISHHAGNQIRAYCPDHHLYLDRRPSDPHWTINTDTGKTFCFTEGRGSNLLYTVCRLLDIGPREAVGFLAGSPDISTATLDIARRKGLRKKRVPSQNDEWGLQDEEPTRPKGLGAIKRDMENRYISDEAYDFFMYPPGKLPTLIVRETVDRYQVFERTWGRYANRAVVPFLMKGEIVGFCAIDILGKDEWFEQHPLKKNGDYRKTLYPLDFQMGECLFGFDDCTKNADDLIITEGAREVMKLHQEGFPNSVAMLGSYMSNMHMQLIGELSPKRIILMFDGDKVGREVTEKVAEKLSRQYSGDAIKKCFIPIGRDPKNLNGNELRSLL